MRLSKTVGTSADSLGETTTHIWDGSNVVLDLDGGGGIIDTYIRGINLIKSTNNGFYVYNAHGDVTALTDATGTKTKDYHYDAFGVEVDPVATDSNPFRYCSEYFDKETDNIYLRARYYNPATGRFSAEDPIKDGLNWYTYCENNPMFFVDPSGLDAIIINQTDAVFGFDHTSVLFQNENGTWYYFYWGLDGCYLTEINKDKMFSLAQLSGHLREKGVIGSFGENFLGWDMFGLIGKNYDNSCYIEGDFSAAYDFFKDKSDNFNPWQYDLFTENCSAVVFDGISLGILKDGTNVGDYMKLANSGYSVRTQFLRWQLKLIKEFSTTQLLGKINLRSNTKRMVLS